MVSKKVDIAQRLIRWYEKSGRHHLPWQQNPSPYRVWISEIMLQQTQVKTVIPYYQKFIYRFPNLNALAKADLDEVLHYWSGLGYYSRARNLHKTAQWLVKQHQARFPNTLNELIQLPGIGESTAGAILSFAMQTRAVILDGNVKRVLCRHFTVKGWPGEAKINKTLWALARQLTPNEKVSAYNQAMMDMGAMLCTRSKPQCSSCPLSNTCLAFSQQAVLDYPNKKPKKRQPLAEKSVMMLVLKNTDNQVLLLKRPSYGIWGGLWSFPECELLTDISNYCQREWGFDVGKMRPLALYCHRFSHYQLNIYPYLVHIKPSKNLLMQTQDHCWLSPDKALTIGIPAPIAKLIDHVYATLPHKQSQRR